MERLRPWLESEGFAKFESARVLSEETSKDDPETEPYRSKYKARDILKSLKSKIEDVSDGYGDAPVSSEDIALTLDEEEVAEDIKSVLSVEMLLLTLDYELAKNFIDCEEVTSGEEYLEKCIGVIGSSFTRSPLYTCLHISCNNTISIIWSNRGEYTKARDYLCTAEDIYKQAKDCGVDAPLNYNEVWMDENSGATIADRKTFFERVHTMTLYYLAQIYMKLGETELSAKYCHVTLVRQMETKQYDAMEWSLNCATLSQYYLTQNQFNLARYCLACAEVINKESFVEFEAQEFDEANEKQRTEEKVQKSRADIYRCWAKYGLNLLEMSHKSMLGETDDQPPLNRDSVDDDEKTYRERKFPGIETTILEESVVDNVAQEYTSAKNLFNFSISFLQKAKEFYLFDGYVSGYVEIMQDTSQLYKYLALFDNNFENRTKMHKRRIDMLNQILLELNPKHFLQICRQLTFEIAEAYTEMSALKKAIIEEDPNKLSAHAVKKINYLLLQGVKYYTGFIDSYKKEGELPTTFEEDDVRGVLLCYFCMARLNNKYYTLDRETKRTYLLKEKACYQFIVDYCDTHPDMPKVFEEEESVSREMLELFDGKMQNVLEQMR